jgi:small subunit ribosomal protein S1
MLENYTHIKPKRGQILDGEVVAITDETVILDVGAKRDAMVSKQEIAQLPETILQELFIGSQMPVFVTNTANPSEELWVSIEKGLAQKDWNRAAELLETEETLELEVVDTNAGGLLTSFGRITGFVPNSLIPGLSFGLGNDAKQKIKQDYLGKTLPLNVIEVNQPRKRLILSGKAAETAQRQQRLEELKPGETITGIVSNVVDFGAFVNLNGIDGLVHISKLAWEKIEHPADVVKPGDEIEVMIEKVDMDRGRVSLNRRALIPGPWDKFAEEHHSGDMMEGTVESVCDFGAFIKLTDSITGLVHSSELLSANAYAPTETIQTDEKVLVRILDINTERQRVSLSMRRVPMDDFAQWMLDSEDDTAPADSVAAENENAASEDAQNVPLSEDDLVIPDEILLATEPQMEDQD